MNAPTRLRYVNQVVGTFLIIVVLLVLAAVIIVSRERMFFAERYPFFAYVTEAELGGLLRGGEIFILGRRAGEVANIRYVTEPRADGRNVEIELAIRSPYQDEIFVDSVLHIRRRLSGVGEAFVEITRGPEHNVVLPPGGTIRFIAVEVTPTTEFGRITDMMGEIREDFRLTRESMVRAFDQFQVTNEQVGKSNERIQPVITDLQEFTPRLSPMADKSDRVLSDLEDFAPRLSPLAEKSDRVLDTTQEAAGRLRDEAEAFAGTGEKMHDGLDNANRVLEGMKRHWLLRRYIEQGKGDKMLSPAQYGGGGYWP